MFDSIKQFFYDEIPVGISNVYIRGAYYVVSRDETKPTIDFFILDPNNNLVYTRRKKSEGIFRFNATQTGIYQFKFSNTKVTLSNLHLYSPIKTKT